MTFRKIYGILLLISFLTIHGITQAQAGVGVLLSTDSIATGKWPFISGIMENSPAAESDLIAYTWLNAVDGVSTKNMSIPDLVKLITGKEGTTVTLRTKSANIETDVTLVRRKLVNKSLLSLITPALIPYRSGKKWGYCDQQKKIIVPVNYTHASQLIDGVAAVEDNGKWGLLDEKGKVILQPVYSHVGSAYEGMIKYIDKDLYGYLDIKGKVVIPAKYKYGYEFNEGLARVKGSNGFYGFVDKTGREVIALKYDNAADFDYGLAAVAQNKHYAFVNTRGEEVTPFKYPMSVYFPKFSNGLCKVFDGKKYGYVDHTGKEILPCKFNNAEDFSNGIAMVVQDDGNDKWTVINKKGEALGTGSYAQVSAGYNNNRIGVSSDNSILANFGYSDRWGKMIIEEKYDVALPFVNSYAAVREGTDGYYLINIMGVKQIDQTYEDIKQYDNGIVVFKDKKRKLAYGSQYDGFKPFTPFKYDYAFEFKNGLAWVNFSSSIIGGGYYIDSKGNEYYDPSADEADKKQSDEDKYVNQPNKLNEHPSDGSNAIKSDDVYGGYLSTGDQKAVISDDKKSRYYDGYNLTVKSGDRLILSMSSSDFTIACILQAPSKQQRVLVGDVSSFRSSASLDTVLTEAGNYTLYITSSEAEKTGSYFVEKKLASPAACALGSNADLCERLTYLEKHAGANYDFITGNLVNIEKGIFTLKTFATDVQLVKGKVGTIEKGFARPTYKTIVYEGSKKEVDKKFAEYEKLLRGCYAKWEFKTTDDPSDSGGVIHTLTAASDYLRQVELAILVDKVAGYSLRIMMK